MTPRTSHFDVIIVGQGLAGTALAWALRWSGARLLILDRDSKVSSSKIAAGLVTPITGQKLVKTWRYSELWPAALGFYRRVETETGSEFFRQSSMLRLFANKNETEIFERRLMSGELEGLVQPTPQPLSQGSFITDRGGFEMSPAGQLDVLSYLNASREAFASLGGYLKIDVDVSREIELAPSGVKLPRWGIASEHLVFCQGFESSENPWFRDVQLKPAKGEILTLRIPRLTEDRVVHCGVWLAPLGAELFRAGSTYDWKHLDCLPTQQGHDEIIFRLREFLKLPFEVVSHEAAVRPIHRNQYPILGLHPVHRQLGYFNGLGSKGSLLAPFFAQQFVSHLSHGSPIDSQVDLNRKTRWRDTLADSTLSPEEITSARRHVKPNSRRSLTEQAQDAIRAVLKLGEVAIDATAGNGHDTHFLANLVGHTGAVYAFDIQQSALEKTSRRLDEANIQNVTLLNHDHAQLETLIPSSLRRQIGAVMFNLGYLPGGDKRVTTSSESTLNAIEQATDFLRADGILSVLSYTGHDGGLDESRAVEAVLDRLPESEFEVVKIESQSGNRPGPRLFLVKRQSARNS